MANRLVDKLWQGVFQRPPDEVFQFILKLIAQAKRRTGGSSLSLEGIYRSLNRSILYMLSSKSRQANDNLAGQMDILTGAGEGLLIVLLAWWLTGQQRIED